MGAKELVKQHSLVIVNGGATWFGYLHFSTGEVGYLNEHMYSLDKRTGELVRKERVLVLEAGTRQARRYEDIDGFNVEVAPESELYRLVKALFDKAALAYNK